MAKDVEHFFIYLLAICTSSFENVQFICPFIYFFILKLFLVFVYLLIYFAVQDRTQGLTLAG
jgi:hypothetical protein